MKSLKAIQTLHKIGKIISTIVFVLCLVGAIGCAVGIACVAALGEDAIKQGMVTAAEMGDESVTEAMNKMNLPFMYTSMAIGLICSAASAVVAKFAQKYFTNELNDGTPFTMRGAKELMRLGIIQICVNLGASFICTTAVAIVEKSADAVDKYDFGGMSIGLGIMFLIISLFCRYGAELTEGRTEAAPAAVEEAPASETAE